MADCRLSAVRCGTWVLALEYMLLQPLFPRRQGRTPLLEHRQATGRRYRAHSLIHQLTGGLTILANDYEGREEDRLEQDHERQRRPWALLEVKLQPRTIWHATRRNAWNRRERWSYRRLRSWTSARLSTNCSAAGWCSTRVQLDHGCATFRKAGQWRIESPSSAIGRPFLCLLNGDRRGSAVWPASLPSLCRHSTAGRGFQR